MQVEYKLLLIELHLMKSLQVGNTDVEKCMEVMAALERLPLNAFLLRKNPHIILTLRKCRKFTGSDQVRRKADYIYHRFKSFFLTWDGSEVNQLVGISMSAFDSKQIEESPAAKSCAYDNDDSKTVSEANSSSHVVSASSSAADNSTAESLPQQTKTVSDDSGHNVSSVDETQLDKSVDADDIVESSSPLRRDDDDSTDLLSTSFVIPLTTAAAATSCDSAIPPVLSSLPSLVQLSRQALDSHAKRTGLSSDSDLNSPVSCSTSSRVVADMFSEDDEQNDSIAELTEKKDELKSRIEEILADEPGLSASNTSSAVASVYTTASEHEMQDDD